MTSDRSEDQDPCGNSPKPGEVASRRPWTVTEARRKLPEILRLARSGVPQRIGVRTPCVLVAATQCDELASPVHLGRFLVESAPRGDEFELPSR